MTDTTPDAQRVRPFADFLREQARGETHDELSVALQTLVAAVIDTGKAGSLSLTIKVKPLKGNSGAMEVEDAIKLNLPEHDRGASIFFSDKAHNLQRTDPAQLVFESLREAPAPPGVDPTTGEILDPPTTGKAHA